MVRIRILMACCLALAFGAHASAQTAAPLELNTPGTLKIAYRTDDKPVSYIENGQPAGFMVELMNAVAQRMGLKPEYISTTFSAMLPAVRNHIYDTAAFGVLVTPERQKVVSFTSAIGYGQAQLVSRKNATLKDLDGAAGKTVAVTTGSALIAQLHDVAPKVQVKEFPNIASSANALRAGQVDGLFTGIATAARVVVQYPDLTATQIVESAANALPIAPDHPKLLAAMNKALTETMNDGTFTKLFVKWNPPGVTIPQRMYTDYPSMPKPAAK